MEAVISRITEVYQKEKENKPSKDSPQKKEIKNLIDKIYIVSQKDIESNKNSPVINKKEFSSDLYEGLNEKEMKSFLETNNIPIKYITKVLKEVFKALSSATPTKNKNNKKNDPKLILTFLEKNKNKITEKHLLLIFKKIKEYNKSNIDEIIKYIINNIKIDDKYFLELLKEEEIDLNKNIIDSLNNCINDEINEEDNFSFITLIKSINLISCLKEIITKEEYDNYEEKINKIIEENLNKKENCTKICDKEFEKDFNIEFINSMKIINSNPNKAYYIQEKITI